MNRKPELIMAWIANSISIIYLFISYGAILFFFKKW
ncbi:hypothetical protein V636_01468 [Staphylococcus aureus T55954]|nr:hypothetical protein T710_01784 [Staphylococcus aureus WMCS6019]EWW93469.1 hypothetical protein V306_00637 [Staphylococcus aureus F82600]EYK65235.1 hypothetical protein V636_01468 [Staphylococcus aureus T55954]CAC7915144.1 membrane protein [Staphylococcus aureus]